VKTANKQSTGCDGTKPLKKAMALLPLLALLGTCTAQNIRTAYPAMAPLSAYLMEREAEIALARSAAPPAISKNATVLALAAHGYETAAKGGNGFVCVVARGWSAGSDDPDFWNPKLRAPICYNEAAARSQVPVLMGRTKLVIGGASRDQVFAALKTAYERGELSRSEPGSMCYMMSKNGYLSEKDPHFKPHLMFFLPHTAPATWGAGLPGTPVLALEDAAAGETVFIVPVIRWSDGELASAGTH
jgi:hypothetical protein